MANGHDDTLIKRVPTYGVGDPGRIGMIPMMSMVALRVVKVTESTGGLTLPESAQVNYQTPQCEVLAVGPQVMFCKVGDMVRIPGETIASKLFIRDATFVMIREDQVFGIDQGMEQSEYVRAASQQKLLTK